MHTYIHRQRSGARAHTQSRAITALVRHKHSRDAPIQLSNAQKDSLEPRTHRPVHDSILFINNLDFFSFCIHVALAFAVNTYNSTLYGRRRVRINMHIYNLWANGNWRSALFPIFQCNMCAASAVVVALTHIHTRWVRTLPNIVVY